MEMGMIGLGRMGGNMVQRLMRKGHRMIAYDRSQEAVTALTSQGAVGVHSLEELIAAFQSRPRVMWLMLPAGPPTSDTMRAVAEKAEAGDIVIDGGNTKWKIALEDAAAVKARALHYVDAGVSGGVWGLQYGYSLMVGGEDAVYRHIEPLLKDLAPEDGGLVHTGPEGSGHFVKMVHNGIEYGLMQAYAEGFQIMKQSSAFPGMDMQAIADAWRFGSVVRSWLLDLIADGLSQDPQLSRFKGWVDDTGEGRWTVETGLEDAVPAPVITLALYERFRSRMEDTYGDKLLAMMRHQFGGHPYKGD
jgi:6-phosphogluconate dehydrogenase